MDLHRTPYTVARWVAPALVGGGVGVVAATLGSVGALAWRDSRSLAGSDSLYTASHDSAFMLWIMIWSLTLGRELLSNHVARRKGPMVWARTALLVPMAAVLTFLPLGLWVYEWDFALATEGPVWSLYAPAWVASVVAGGITLWSVERGLRAVVKMLVRWEIPGIKPLKDPGTPAWTALGQEVLMAFAAALPASIVWYLLGLATDRVDLGVVAGSFTLGALWVGLSISLPDALWRAWIVVRRGPRPGWRLPVVPDRVGLSERFVGHYPSGTDLHLPPEAGVAELHLSVLARRDGTWSARGLSQRPVTVKRLLEWVELTWDPDRPAPFETPLRHQDLVELGPGEDGSEVELEFVVVPRVEDR